MARKSFSFLLLVLILVTPVSAPRLFAEDQPVAAAELFIVVLKQPSVAEQIIATEPDTARRQALLARPEMMEYRSRLERRHRELAAALAPLAAIAPTPGIVPSPDIVVTATHSVLLNALFVTATPRGLDILRNHPDVKAIYPNRKRQLLLDSAPALIGAPAAWDLLGGMTNAGTGIKIAIIDTGVNQLHDMFADSGFVPPTGYPKPAENSAHTNNKVIVARNYVTTGNGYASQAVNSPQDERGHGTAVASIAGGNWVSAPVGPIHGIAPRAFIGNYKVFGASGTNDNSTSAGVISAIEGAVEDGMDVINMSLGGGAVLPELDPEQQAVKLATQMGVLVVISAGNSGPGTATTKSPGTAPEALTVGSSTPNRIWVNGLQVTSTAAVPSNLQTIPMIYGEGQRPLEPFGPYPAVSIKNQDLTELGCPATPLPAGSLTGKIAVIKRGACRFDEKATNAKNAGAVGVVIRNNIADPVLETPGGTFTIPAVLIPLTQGEQLVNFLASNAANITFQSSSQKTALTIAGDEISSFSSRGPDIAFQIKPDLVAPGQSIYGAGLQNAPLSTYSSALNGTSFSSPMAAGAAALVKQLNPGITPAGMKSLLVNSAEKVTTVSGQPARIIETGNGRLNVGRAARQRTSLEPSSASFGIEIQNKAGERVKSVEIRNLGTTAATYQLDLVESAVHPRVHVTLSASTVQVPAGGTGNFSITANYDAPLISGVFDGYVGVRTNDGSQVLTASYWGAVGIEDPSNQLTITNGGDGIAQALANATPGTRIIINDSGAYTGGINIAVNKDGIPLTGVSITSSSTPKPQLVASNPDEANVTISAPGKTRLSGLTLIGGYFGMHLSAAEAEITNVDVNDATTYGILGEDSTILLRNSSIFSSGNVGLAGLRSRISMSGTTINSNIGGLLLVDSGALISSSDIRDNRAEGIRAIGNRVALFETRVRGNQATNVKLDGAGALIAGSQIENGVGTLTHGVQGVGSAMWIQDSALLNNGRDGISVENKSGLFSFRNLIADNKRNALRLTAGSVGEARANSISNNARGISVELSTFDLFDSLVTGTKAANEGAINLVSGSARLFNSTVAKNLGSGLKRNDGMTFVTNSIFDANTGGDFVGVASADVTTNIISGGQFRGENWNLHVDPGFNAPGSGDFSLRVGSPAIDKADTAQMISDADIRGRRRQVDGDQNGEVRADLGAFEYNSTTPPSLVLPVLSVRGDEFVGIAVVNPTGSTAHVKMQAFDLQGATYGRVFEKDIEPRGQLSILLSEAIGSPREGWVEITSDGLDATSFSLLGNYSLTKMDGAEIGPAFSSELLFPELRLSVGEDTRYFLVNPNEQSVRVSLKWVRATGASVTHPAVTIPKKGALSLRASQLLGAGDGYVTATAENNAPIFGMELFGPPSSIGGLLALDLRSAGEQLYGAQLASTGGVETTLNVVNLGATTASVKFEAFSEDGRALASAAVNIQAGYQYRRTAREIFGFTQDAVGWVRVSSAGAKLLGSLSFSDSGMNFLASLPLQTRAAQEFILGHVAQTADVFTGVTLLNTQQNTAQISLEVFSRSSTKTGEAVIQIQPGEKRARLLNEHVPGFGIQEGGFIRVRSNVPVFGFELFGHYGMKFMSAVPQQVTIWGMED